MTSQSNVQIKLFFLSAGSSYIHHHITLSTLYGNTSTSLKQVVKENQVEGVGWIGWNVGGKRNMTLQKLFETALMNPRLKEEVRWAELH